MPKNDKPKKQFDIHRTLPSRQAQPHSLKAKNISLADKTEVAPKKRQRGFNFKRSVISVVLIIVLFSFIVAVWDAISLSRASAKMFGSGNLFSLVFGQDLANQNGRTNILLAGYSADDAGHQGANLTDSIMLISIDSRTKTGYMLSIPRDLWVNIPGYGHAKINEAYQDGNLSGFSQSGYPAGGMGLLEKVVSDNFNVTINYYALVNYASFRETVNAVGGITINIQSSDPRGIYDPSLDYTSLTCCALAKYPNGPVKLDGKQALNLARARGDAPGSYGFGQADFDRTTHQRQMVVALRQKAVSWRVILNPAKTNRLVDGLASNVKTDIGTSNVLPLFSLVNKVSASALKSESLRDLDGKNLLTDYGGALIPLGGVDQFEAIQNAIAKLNQ